VIDKVCAVGYYKNLKEKNVPLWLSYYMKDFSSFNMCQRLKTYYLNNLIIEIIDIKSFLEQNKESSYFVPNLSDIDRKISEVLGIKINNYSGGSAIKDGIRELKPKNIDWDIQKNIGDQILSIINMVNVEALLNDSQIIKLKKKILKLGLPYDELNDLINSCISNKLKTKNVISEKTKIIMQNCLN
jgi:hypothetical protein